MYCMNCGVELQKGVEKCPLCGLKVYHPDITEEKEAPPYPLRYRDFESDGRGSLFIGSLLLLIPILVCFAIDIPKNSGILWSGYVAGGILTAYLALVLPLWFPKKNPVIFFPIDMLAGTLLVLYICIKTGGSWFLSFALPVLLVTTAILETVIALLRYASQEKAHRVSIILGGGLIGLGALCLLIENRLYAAFAIPMTWWSLIPLIASVIIGLSMILIGANARLRAGFYKRFFI